MRIAIIHPDRSTQSIFAPHLPTATWLRRHTETRWDILVRWGNADGPDAPFTFNAAWALKNASDLSRCTHLLHLNGIPHRLAHPHLDSLRWTAQYRLHMVDLRPIAIQRLQSGSARAVSVSSRTRSTLASLVGRTLYALGLHFGAVDIGIDRRGRPCVIGVDAAPSVASRLLNTYAVALADAVLSLRQDVATPSHERAARVLLGADPEFIMKRRHDGTLRYASDFFPDAGTVGYDRQCVTIAGRRRHPIAEIRPAPTISPHALVDTIRNELTRAHRLAPDLNTEWLAGAQPHPHCATGGHIHFSGIRPNTFLLRALDNYLAIPSLLLEDADRARQRRSRYGWLGEFREKAHGGFEYRTLSSWLGGIHRTRMTLCLAKLIAVEYPRLSLHLLKTEDDHRAFYRGQKDVFRKAIDALWDDLQATDSYTEWSQDLNRTRIWIHNRRLWRERTDLKRQWRIQ